MYRQRRPLIELLQTTLRIILNGDGSAMLPKVAAAENMYHFKALECGAKTR
jgi:hypothetical protein